MVPQRLLLLGEIHRPQFYRAYMVLFIVGAALFFAPLVFHASRGVGLTLIAIALLVWLGAIRCVFLATRPR